MVCSLTIVESEIVPILTNKVYNSGTENLKIINIKIGSTCTFINFCNAQKFHEICSIKSNLSYCTTCEKSFITLEWQKRKCSKLIGTVLE